MGSIRVFEYHILYHLNIITEALTHKQHFIGAAGRRGDHFNYVIYCQISSTHAHTQTAR